MSEVEASQVQVEEEDAGLTAEEMLQKWTYDGTRVDIKQLERLDCAVLTLYEVTVAHVEALKVSVGELEKAVEKLGKK